MRRLIPIRQTALYSASSVNAWLERFIMEQIKNIDKGVSFLLSLTNSSDLSAPSSARIEWSDSDLRTLAGAVASARLLAKVTGGSASIVETRIELPGVIKFYDEEDSEEWDPEDGALYFTPSSEWLSVTPGLPGQASVRLEVWEQHDDGDVSAIEDLKDLGISDVVEDLVLEAYESLGMPRSLWPQKDEHILAAVQRNPGFIAQLSDAERTEAVIREVVRQAPAAVQLLVFDEARMLTALQENLACVRSLNMSHIDLLFDHPLSMAGVIEYIQDNLPAIEALDWTGLDEYDSGKDLLEHLRQKVQAQAAQRPRQR
jgi:hypothetical protein